ncbi:hypothetical protein [Geomonas propionica]|uniref:ResB-like domain-containing protein n=1 Tax=Geomonas propionica TaxID=2798582 RepID=A0ABS0YXS4_9BACT|nr:hypothetical protein [Geomonas propionica]MBJ6802753.1 hypothetical protein [Geomonas propionica]
MSRFASIAKRVATSPAVTPCVLALFLLLYVGIAFGSNEPLTALMAITRGNVALLALLALVPLSGAARLVAETATFLKRRRMFSGVAGSDPAGLFEEAVALPEQAPFEGEGERLGGQGYRVRAGSGWLSAGRGVTLFPARFLYLLGVTLLFSGLLASLTGRATHRQVVLEGEALPVSRDLVQRIVLKEEPGLLLQRTLDIAVAVEGGGERHFGLYPPGKHRGYYLYPRYLGVAPLLRFSAPDLPGGFEQYAVLSIYPPGKEDTFQIPGSPYRFIFQMAPGEGPDPYASGRITLQFRVLKGESQVFAGSAPLGGETSGGGYRVALPEFRRVVVTDFVQDAGVPLIWSAVALLLWSLCWFVPVRLLRPRQEILVVRHAEGVSAFSRAEGGRRAHAGRFHDLLDQLQPVAGGEP